MRFGKAGQLRSDLIAKANNNIYFMTEDGLIYDLIGVLTTGGYNAIPLDRPAFC